MLVLQALEQHKKQNHDIILYGPCQGVCVQDVFASVNLVEKADASLKRYLEQWKWKWMFLHQLPSFLAKPPQRDHTPTYLSTPLWKSGDQIRDYLLNNVNSPCFRTKFNWFYQLGPVRCDQRAMISFLSSFLFINLDHVIVYNNVTTPSLTQWPPTPLCETKPLRN